MKTGAIGKHQRKLTSVRMPTNKPPVNIQISTPPLYGFDPVWNCGYSSLHIGEPPIIYSKLIVSINA